VNFYPNDQLDAPVPQTEMGAPPLPLAEGAWVGAHDQAQEDYFEQAGNLYRMMTEQQKTRLAEVIASGLAQAEGSVQERMLGYLGAADPDYENRVRNAVEA
jgi:catalase